MQFNPLGKRAWKLQKLREESDPDIARQNELINDKTIIFDGCGDQARAAVPIIEYKNRNLRFQFAAPFFEDEAATQYKYFLEGYDDLWSDWSLETQKDYTNIDAGFYTFRVQAKNVYENLSQEAVFQFKVLPPWYQTWWAYLIYIFFLYCQ